MRIKKCIAGVLAMMLSMSTFGACGGGVSDLTVYMPDGAPCLAFAKLMHEDTEDDGIDYKVVAPNLIKTKVTYTDEDKNADLCVLPLTAATKLLGSGEKYQMLGVVTHGNLYLISKNTDTMYEANTLSSLVGKTVGVLQLNEVPGLIFKTTLQKAGVAYQENGEPNADAVNLVPIAGASDVGALDGVDIYLLAEPAVNAQSAKGFKIVGDVQEIYGGANGYPQAVLVAKKSVLKNAKQRAKVADFQTALGESVAWMTTIDLGGMEDHIVQGVQAVMAHLEDATYATSLTVVCSTMAWNRPLETIARCGVWYDYAQNAKQDVVSFITLAQSVNANMATMPSDAFFYNPSVEA